MHDNLTVDETSVLPGESKVEYRERMFKYMRKMEAKRGRELATGKVPIVMDVDDFGFLLPGYDDLLQLKKTYPGLRITAFTIPMPKEFFGAQNSKLFKVDRYKAWAKIVNENDWIEVALHGFAHTHFEMETSYDKAMQTLLATENLFEQLGLKYSKIFKAPYWQYSYDALCALRDRGYVIAIDRNHQRPVPEGSKTYVYNWSFEEPLPGGTVIKGHGHFTGRNRNNIRDALANIVHHVPATTTFLTIGEYLERPDLHALERPIISGTIIDHGNKK